MLIRGGNGQFGQPTFSNGDTVEDYNCAQLEPHTAICAGVTGLTFRRCNLLNCAVPGEAIVEDCLTLQKSFCSHLHPEWVGLGLSECAEDCGHVVDTDEIWIDGQLVDTIYYYEDTRVT